MKLGAGKLGGDVCFAHLTGTAAFKLDDAARAELKKALAEGAVESERIVEIGEVLAGWAAGRGSEEEITIAKLTGVAAQDLAAVRAVAGRLALLR